jgi:hypothetical protein
MPVVITAPDEEPNPYLADSEGWYNVPLDGRNIAELPSMFLLVVTCVTCALMPEIRKQGRVSDKTGQTVNFCGMIPISDPATYLEIDFTFIPGRMDKVLRIRFREQDLDTYLDWLLKKQAAQA